jgi:Putative zinc-finger
MSGRSVGQAPRPPRRCRLARGAMPLAFYGGLSVREQEALQRHLERCGGCATEWQTLRHELNSVEADAAFPREREIDWERLARETVRRARAAAAPAARRLSRPAWMPAAAAWGAALAATVIVLSLLTTRPDRPPAGPQPAAGPQAAGARFLQQSLARQGAARYLRDSRSLLLGLLQAPSPCRKEDDDAYDVSLEKRRSLELLRRKNLYEGTLRGPADERLAGLMDQLEAFLIQVSSFSDCATGRQLHDLREAIERRQILLRIDLVTRETEGRGARA